MATIAIDRFYTIVSLWILAVFLSCASGCATVDTEGDGEVVDLIETEVTALEGIDTENACSSDNVCDDGIACTIDHCVGGQCAHEPCADCCEEGLTCIPNYGCGTALTPCTVDEECVDSIRCTLDRCLDEIYCQNTPQHGLCEEGEVCMAALGCIPQPPEHCEVDEDCYADHPCLGEWYCDYEFGCQFQSLLDCDDDEPCTDDACDDEAGGCVHPARDMDTDGHGDRACGGDDCDDGNPERYPGADEECNGIDDDCDTIIDEACCDEGSDCTTSCGTTGTRECNPDGTEGPCNPPPETCNGGDDDCDGSADEGFDCSPPGRTDPCTTGCDSTGTIRCLDDCGWGACTPPTESCNGADDDCDGVIDDGYACIAGSTSACLTSCSSIGARTCQGDCTWDACVPPPETCNGVDDDCDGACDDGFTCCADGTRDCSTLGYFTGTAVCEPDCGGWNISGCTNCGNGIVNAGEQCDGVDLGGNNCTTIGMGFGGGVLRCAAGCRFDTADCTNCGNGVIDAGEQCDGSNLGGNNCTTIGGGFSGGTLRCSGSCAFDTSGCTSFDPSGVYVITPPPVYTCAFGLVNFSIAAMTFTDNGAMLFVYGAPCPVPNPMTGPSAMTTRTINVSCTYPGTCNETYSLSGSFVNDNRWTGTFQASFSGSCFDCDNQSWSVAGQR